MATTASKPRSAKAAADEAASVTRATARRKKATGNASGERKAKAAQTARRTAKAPSTSNGGKSSGATGRAKPAAAGSSKRTAAANGNGRSSSSGGGSPNGKGRSTSAKSATKRTSTKDTKARDTQAKDPQAKDPQTEGTPEANDAEQTDGGAVATTGKHLASALFKSTGHERKKHPIARKVAKKAAQKTLKTIGRRSLEAGAHTLRTVVESAGTAGRQAVRAGASRVSENRPPIQASVDIAAPLNVVWEEWLTFGAFTEGLHRIDGVERDGDELIGTVSAAHERDWRAEIVDEREEQAFAWRSLEGTDCAGLVTFHRLSERLTRIEADLDVVPTNPAEAFLLSLPIPTRRAERELQLFKAHVEFINPDEYEQDDPGGESDNDGDPQDAGNDD